MDADGGNERTLLRNADEPSWAPDGSKLAVIGSSGLALFDLTTKRIKLIRTSTHLPSNPVWSPDGTQIAVDDYPRNVLRGTEIFVVNSDGTHLRRLTTTSENSYNDDPTWTSDGRIVFAHHGPLRDLL
jgi:Tol biopolymer transport system component